MPIGEAIPEFAPDAEPEWIEGRYFPHFPSTDRIFVLPAETELEEHHITWVSDFRINDSYKTMMALTLVGMQGIINRNKPRVYLDYRNPLTSIDHFWIPYLEEHVKVIEFDLDHLSALNFLLRRYSSHFSGAVVYDPEIPETVNLATMIAGLEDRIILAPEQLEMPGIPNFDSVTDLRKLVQEQNWDTSEESKYNIYKWVYDNLWDRLEHRMIGTISPGPPTSQESGGGNYHPVVLAQRDLYVALRLPALWLDPRDSLEAELYSKFLEEAPSPIPVMGASPDERSSAAFVSGYGDWITALSWPNAPLSGGNITVFSGIRPKIKSYQPQIDPNRILATLGEKPVVTIWCSDGDNLHYQMERGFNYPARWTWDNVQGSRFGWTTNPILTDIAPLIWNYYIDTRDEVSLVSGLSGGGYAYPNLMNDEQIQNYLRYTSTYLNITGIRTVAIDGWGGKGGWDEYLAKYYYEELRGIGYLGAFFGLSGWPWGIHFNYQNQPTPAIQQSYLLNLANTEGVISDIMNSRSGEVLIDLTSTFPWAREFRPNSEDIEYSYFWHTGNIITDPDANEGKTLHFSAGNPNWRMILWGPYATLAPGEYNAIFRFKTLENQDSKQFIWIDIGRFWYTRSDFQNWQNFATLKIAPNEFNDPNTYQNFSIPFTLNSTTNHIEFRIDHKGTNTDLYADHIQFTREDSLSLPLFVPVFIVTTELTPQTDNLRLFIEGIEAEGGIVLSPEEFIAALNPEYMIEFATPILGSGDTRIAEAKALLNKGKFFSSLLTVRNALREVTSVEIVNTQPTDF